EERMATLVKKSLMFEELLLGRLYIGFFKRRNEVCSDLLRRSFYQRTIVITHFLNVDLRVLWQRLPKK
ncbi:hypothetical protein HGM15179_007730, partial [Zosterops borbonicus]